MMQYLRSLMLDQSTAVVFQCGPTHISRVPDQCVMTIFLTTLTLPQSCTTSPRTVLAPSPQSPEFAVVNIVAPASC